MAVARLSYGVRAVNVGMCSSGPCVVRVVSVLTMQSCMLVGMDVISLPKVAVARAYRLGGFREVSEFVLRSYFGAAGTPPQCGPGLID